MNRFYDIPFIGCRELMPWECQRSGIDKTTGQFELGQRIKLRSDIAGGVLILEAGEISDLASIPSLLEFAVMNSDDQRIAAGAWFHDHLFRNGGYVKVYNEDESFKQFVQLSFDQSNKILCDEAMPDLFASKSDRWKVYLGLSVGGRSNFKKPI